MAEWVLGYNGGSMAAGNQPVDSHQHSLRHPGLEPGSHPLESMLIPYGQVNEIPGQARDDDDSENGYANFRRGGNLPPAEGIYLQIPTAETNVFTASPFYKLSLKRYIHKIKESTIHFKPTLTYLDYKRIITLCGKEAAKRNITLHIDPTLTNHITQKEIHLETRSRLGIEIKNQEEKLHPRFQNYRTTVDQAMARKLRPKQMWDSFFMTAMQKSGNFSVPGSGKTASVLGMYAYLKAKGLIRRIVVICPKNAFGSWIDEFNICLSTTEPLNCFNIAAYKTPAAKKRGIRLESGSSNLLLFNFETAGTYQEDIATLVDGHTLLVFDEVHKVKRIDGIHAAGAIEIASKAQYIVAMTGTPIPNSYSDIYNFLHILFPSEYKEFFDFSPGLLRNPSPAEMTAINQKLQPFFCRTTKKELGVPAANQDSIIYVDASHTENRLLKILKMRYRKNRLALMLRILQLESNPRLLLQSLDLNDFRYLIDDEMEAHEIDVADYSSEVAALISSCEETTKFRTCVNIAADLVRQDKPVVVWCIFISSIDALAKALKAQGITAKCIYGEVALEDRQQILADFKASRFQVLITNPHTLAESVSLHSVCHDAVYFEYSYNLVHLLQSKDRIHRLGLADNQYTQYYYMQAGYVTEDGPWSMNGVIYDRLMGKEQIMLDAIDSNILEAMPTSDEDLDMIFAKL
ncbi:MAG: DEAD/DEAH box helicase [Defluviitaleaceae bacterium]|nr:DEAD/DEAH box helicase [Defluviitaleaceae bacterium]